MANKLSRLKAEAVDEDPQPHAAATQTAVPQYVAPLPLMHKGSGTFPEHTLVSFVVTLPSEIANIYVEQADRVGVDVQTLLSSRLGQCQDHLAVKPLYFNDSDRQQLEAAADLNFSSPAEVIQRFRSMTVIDVAGHSVRIPPIVLQRLESRKYPESRPMAEFVEETVIDALRKFVRW